MKKLLLIGIAVLGLIATTSSCKKDKDKRVTHIYGKVTDTSEQPVEGVQIEIEATRKGTLGKGDFLKTLFTDKEGTYSVMVEPGSQYSSIQVINQYFVDTRLNDKYLDYEAYSNGQYLRNCCPASIGQKTE